MPTLADFAKEFGGQLLASEGALWRTLRGLFRPGYLTLAYLAGQRRRYLTPLRLFLSICIVCAALVQWVRPEKLPGEQDLLSGALIKLGAVDGAFVCENLPAERCAYWQRRWTADPDLLHDLKRTQTSYKQVMRQLVFMAMAPTMAVLLQLAYWHRRQPFGVHMVTALHIHCALLPLLTAHVMISRWLPVMTPWSGGLTAVMVVSSIAMSLRRVYGGSRWANALRMLAVAIAYVAGAVFWAGLGSTWTVRQTLM
ncbi:DUF3667 domain-containing protein [Pelomonas sp. APW6]|uniref:DUF3667 domain-containing protein n=1 Tax=Roseateles subflavus TaxID=3053353 RepID=A0ABT7LCU1_9BURK|nr:DUF3667 domain-containing protein [Pelomonas sp. APW6]MDL5030680.1 DUF3667 domain-containing protein [Pelomonas sp. APW6]